MSNETTENSIKDQTTGVVCINDETKLPYILSKEVGIVKLSSMWMFFNGYISYITFIEMYTDEEPENVEEVIKLFNCWTEGKITNQELYNNCVEKYQL